MRDASGPWDETWRSVRDEAGELVLADGKTVAECAEGTASLISAAPAMARLLCRLEWDCGQCRLCWAHQVEDHRDGCPIDAALSAAGLGAEERERVRQK